MSYEDVFYYPKISEKASLLPNKAIPIKKYNEKIYNLKNNNKIIIVNSQGLDLKNLDNQNFFDPSKPLYRFLILLLSCFVGFGACICYDSPAPLQDQIRRDMGISGSQFMAFYAWYSWPNVVICFFGGYLIDKVFGIRKATFIFAGLVLVGNIIFSVGAIWNMYWLMCLGRFVFGVGGESLAVAQNFYAILWFKGKEINLVFGLQLSVSRLGSTVSFNALVPIYLYFQKYLHKNLCLGATFMLVTVTCLISFICALLLIYLDWRAEKFTRRQSNNQEAIATTEEEVSLADIKTFSLNVWLINIVCVCYYVALFTFIGLGIPFFQNKFGLTLASASMLNSIVYIISAFASPFLGFVVDQVGKNLTWLVLSFLSAIGAHFLLAFTMLNPYVSTSILGVSYSILASALWPLVSYEVPASQLGTAYGLMQAFMNTGLALFSQVTGALVDYKGYLFLEIFFLTMLFVGFIALSVLQMNDRLLRGTLDMTPWQRDVKAKSLILPPPPKVDTTDGSSFLEEEPFFYDETDDSNPLYSPPPSQPPGCSTTPGLSSGRTLMHPQIRPRSSFYLRNRYLSRIGAQLPMHVHASNKSHVTIPYHGGIMHDHLY